MSLDHLTSEIVGLLVEVDEDAAALRSRALAPDEAKRLGGLFEELLGILVRDPGQLHEASLPNLGIVLEGLLAHFRAGLAEAVEEGEGFSETIEEAIADHLEDVQGEWVERIFDVVPVAVERKPTAAAQPILKEVTRAYVAGLDLAATGLARATMETVIEERTSEGFSALRRSGRATEPSSPWAQEHFDPRMARRGTPLIWRIEDLHKARLLNDDAAAHAHVLRQLGNDALHRGHGGRSEALDALRALSRFFGAAYALRGRAPGPS